MGRAYGKKAPNLVAALLREARAQYGWSQREVSKRLGGYAIAPIEAGTYLPSDEAAEKLAHTLRLPPEFFEVLRRERERWGRGRQAEHALLLVGECGRQGGHLHLDVSGYPTGGEALDLAAIVGDRRAFAFRLADDTFQPVFAAQDVLVVSGLRAYLPGDFVLVCTAAEQSFCGRLVFQKHELTLCDYKNGVIQRLPRDQVRLIRKVVLRILA